jgi:hypothetical protein
MRDRPTSYIDSSRVRRERREDRIAAVGVAFLAVATLLLGALCVYAVLR